MITIESPLVHEVLSAFRGKSAFYCDIDGNNGDELLKLGSLQVLRQSGVGLSTSLQDCELIVVRGNGAMIDAYREPVEELARIAMASQQPMIFLPSSWDLRLESMEPFIKRTAETILFAREQFSFDFLREHSRSPQLTILLDHDIALGLDLDPLSIPISESHDLIALRTDAEQASPSALARGARKLYNSMVPAPARAKARPVIASIYSRVQASGHVRALPSEAEGQELPRIVGDISDSGLYSFEEFCSVIGGSRRVTTSRLHAGVLAARLGKSTQLLSGSTPKIRGVYEFSLAGLENVEFGGTRGDLL